MTMPQKIPEKAPSGRWLQTERAAHEGMGQAHLRGSKGGAAHAPPCSPDRREQRGGHLAEEPYPPHEREPTYGTAGGEEAARRFLDRGPPDRRPGHDERLRGQRSRGLARGGATVSATACSVRPSLSATTSSRTRTSWTVRSRFARSRPLAEASNSCPPVPAYPHPPSRPFPAWRWTCRPSPYQTMLNRIEDVQHG